MFEKSILVVRDGRRRTWITLGSVVAQIALITTIIVAPLIYPKRLPPVMAATHSLKEVTFHKPPVVTPPKPSKPIVVRVTNPATRSAPNAAPAAAPAAAHEQMGPILTKPPSFDSGAPVALPAGTLMATGYSFTALPGSGPGTGTGPAVSVKPGGAGGDGHGSMKISSGVMAGRLLAPITPRYPPIAVAARLEGIVVVTATIDKNGRIVGLQVVSGPLMLRTAAVDAVKEARYKPYLLNGEPTEVMTTIAVNFRMEGHLP